MKRRGTLASFNCKGYWGFEYEQRSTVAPGVV